MLAGLIAALTGGCGCSSGKGEGSGKPGSMTGGTSGSSTGSGGVDAGGTGGGSGRGGTTDAGDGGAAGAGGTTATGGDTAGTGGISDAADRDAAGSDGVRDGDRDGDDLTKVLPTAGCGTAAAQAVGAAVRYTIQTMGTKPTGCADSKCGDWSYEREYFVTLPEGYDKTKPYPLVLQGTGCTETGLDVFPLNNNVDSTVIRVGLTPPPNTIGHATNPGQGCFDDREGDDSVDWVFYETLYDKLAGALCFDRNRVFASGVNSGASWANELGCKYAGDPLRPVRGVLPNGGGLPTDPRFVPTCTRKPMAGMWIAEDDSTSDPPSMFVGSAVAIARAMRENGCTIGTSYYNTMLDDFPIGGGNADSICKRIRGCPDLYPLVACPLRPGAPRNQDFVANPGFSTFIKLFSMPPLRNP